MIFDLDTYLVDSLSPGPAILDCAMCGRKCNGTIGYCEVIICGGCALWLNHQGGFEHPERIDEWAQYNPVTNQYCNGFTAETHGSVESQWKFYIA